MSRDTKPIWQQKEQLNGGGSTRERASKYISLWEGRCYPDGIPDEVPALLEKTGRAPSYKAIAVCILRNDLKLHGLGFSDNPVKWAEDLYWEKRRADENKQSGQMDIFN